MWKSETARLALAKEPSLLPNAAGDKKKGCPFRAAFFMLIACGTSANIRQELFCIYSQG